jgi:hypothetical protein
LVSGEDAQANENWLHPGMKSTLCMDAKFDKSPDNQTFSVSWQDASSRFQNLLPDP